MTDTWDELIGNLLNDYDQYRAFPSGASLDKHCKSRAALRSAIDEVVKQNEGFRLMMQSETLEKLDKAELILIIHGWHNKDHAYQCDIARLESQLAAAREDAERLYSATREDSQTLIARSLHCALIEKEQHAI